MRVARNVDTRDTNTPCACRARTTGAEAVLAESALLTSPACLPSRATRARDPTRLAVGTTALSAPPAPPSDTPSVSLAPARRIAAKRCGPHCAARGAGGKKAAKEGEERERALTRLSRLGVGEDRATAGGG